MKKFDTEKYRLVLGVIKKKGEFKGKAIKNKSQIHEMISKKLNMSVDTVKYWERDRSNGPDPRIPGLLEHLEEYLELPQGTLQKRTDETVELTKEERKIMTRTTDFEKTQIMECYERIKKFVRDMEVGDEDIYYEIRNMIEMKKIALPQAVYAAMLAFMDDVVEPYVFEDTMEIFTEKEASCDEDGKVDIKTEQAFNKLMVHFMENLLELDKKIDAFAESELKPYLEP